MTILTFFEKYTHIKIIAYVILSTLVLIMAFFGGKSMGLTDIYLGAWLLTVKFLGAFFFFYLMYGANMAGLLNNWSFDIRQWLAVVALVLIYMPIVLIEGFNIPQGRPPWLMILSDQSTGFFEELQFRGVLLLALAYVFLKHNLQSPILKAIILSSLYFGAIHLVNLLMGNAIGGTIIQILGATLFGIGFALFAVIVRNIWIIAIVHGVNNGLDFNILKTLPVVGGYGTYVVAAVITIIMLILYNKDYENQFVNQMKNRI